MTNFEPDAEQTNLRPGWARRRAATAFDIELTALKLYAAHGVANVTVDDVANAAGISRRTFYRYFQTPDDVIGAQGQRFLAQVSAQFRAQPANATISRAFLAAIGRVSRSKDEDEVHRLVRAIARKSPEEVLRAVQRAKALGSSALEAMIAERLRMSGRDPQDAGLLASVLMTVMVHVGSGGGGADALGKYERALSALSQLTVKRASRKRATKD